MHTPFVIGHAAAAGEAPANTLAGVRAALAAGAEAMEIDVQLSRDGIPVLMHDNTVDRTTNLKGPVSGLTFAELQAGDAGDGEPVPSLAQVLELVAGRLTVLSELKSTPGNPELDARLVSNVLGVIETRGGHAWNAIHSFDAGIVERARASAPRISAALITSAVPFEKAGRLFARALARNAQAVSVEHTAITAEFVRAAKQRQLTVWTWTADTEADWARVTAAGVDGIITNLPHRLREWLKLRE